MYTYATTSKMTCQTGKRDQAVPILLEGARLLEAYPDCAYYVVLTDPADADVVWVSELWTSQAAHAASLNDPKIMELLALGTPLLVSLPEVFTMVPVGGKGI